MVVLSRTFPSLRRCLGRTYLVTASGLLTIEETRGILVSNALNQRAELTISGRRHTAISPLPTFKRIRAGRVFLMKASGPCASGRVRRFTFVGRGRALLEAKGCSSVSEIWRAKSVTTYPGLRYRSNVALESEVCVEKSCPFFTKTRMSVAMSISLIAIPLRYPGTGIRTGY